VESLKNQAESIQGQGNKTLTEEQKDKFINQLVA